MADSAESRDEMGADLSRVCVVGGIVDEVWRYEMRHERRFRIPDDLRTLQRAIYDLSPISLVVLDPIMGYCGKGDGTGVAGMHALLEPLAWMAARTHVAIVATIHLRKGPASSVFRAAGNPAFTTASRAVWGIVRDEDDPRRRLMLPVKLNLAPDGDALAFQIEGEGKLAWNGTPVPVEDGRKKKSGGKKGGGEKLLAAAAWLRELLAAGPRRASEVLALAKREGISKPTLKLAKWEIGASSTHCGTGRGFWVWTASDSADGSKCAQKKSKTDEPLDPLPPVATEAIAQL